jgi:tetratricopeptide (TPR) repeat protein
MAITEPKLKKTELANHISALSGTFRKPKESEINALKEELESLKNKALVFAAEYYHLLSNIAGLEGDIEALITHYEKSLSFAREDKDFKYDYAIALLNRGMLNQAQEQWEQLSKHGC